MTSNTIAQLFTGLPEDEALRTQALSRVLHVANQLWENEPDSPDLDLLAQKAGDASREEPWRTPLGESGLVDFFCGLLGTDGLRIPLTVHILRVIGNSCADKDENRARVVASACLPKIVALLNNDDILAFVIPVLFNICVEYEPAQKAVYQAGLNPELMSLISSSRLANAEAFMNFICKLLSFVAVQEPEANLVHPATPFVLLSLATNPQSPVDVEDFLGLASVALTYLSNQQFQQTFLETPNATSLFLQSFSKSCGSFDLSQVEDEDQAQLKEVQSVFTQALADLSAHPLFASSCQLGGPEAQTLQRWISTPYIPLQGAACLALGNIARSDETCIFLVQTSQIHKQLISVLAEPSTTDANLLHSVLSFLKNLSIPATNKSVLGDAGLFEPHILTRIWELDTQPQVQFDAASLTRLLLVNCPANVRRICAPLSPDPASPAHDRTRLHLLMDLHMRSDQEPTKMETARAVATVCRVLHANPISPLMPRATLPNASSPSEDSSSNTTRSPLQDFYDKHRELANILIYIGLQSKFPVLRSELWFVLALMARTIEGATVVARSTQHFEFVGVLVEAVTGEKVFEEPERERQAETLDAGSPPGRDSGSSPSASSEISISRLPGLGGLEPQMPGQQTDPAKAMAMTKVDRENGLVLIAELLRRCPRELLPLPKNTFRRILKTGGELVVNERNEGKPHADDDDDNNNPEDREKQFEQATLAMSGPAGPDH